MAQAALAQGNPAALAGYAVEDQVGFLLRRAHQRHAAIFLDAMAALGPGIGITR